MGASNNFYLYAVLVLNLLASFFMLKDLGGLLRTAQIMIFIIILLASIYIAYGVENSEKDIYALSMAFFVLVIINSLGLYYLTKTYYFELIGLLNIVGLYASVALMPEPAIEKKQEKEAQSSEAASAKAEPLEPSTKKESLKKELEGMTLSEPEVIVEEIKTKKAKKSVKKKLKKHIFAASKKSSIYHEKKCPRAKGIPGKNKIKFNSRFEAENSGFTAHECVE